MADSLTENLAPTYSSSGDARLDFLFHVIEGSSLERTTELLNLSWRQSPLDTMKLIMNVRDIRRGKGIRAQFLICLKWLYEHQLDSLLANLRLFAEFGCWKDYLNLLLIALFGELCHDTNESREHKEPLVSAYDRVILRTIPKEKRRELAATKTTIHQVKRKLVATDRSESGDISRVTVTFQTVNSSEKPKPLEYRWVETYFPEKALNEKAFYKLKTGHEKLKLLKRYRLEFFRKVYTENGNFKRLYDEIVHLFARQLAEDSANLDEPKSTISLVSKWLPASCRYFDKYLFIVLPLARKFFSLTETSSKIDKSEASPKRNGRSTVRAFEKVCTALRKRIKIPETEMSRKAWNEIRYYCVPSKAMLRYRGTFARNDFDRFNAFVESKPVKGSTLTPGELITEIIKIGFVDGNIYTLITEDLSKDKQLEEKVLESQWQSLVDDIKSKGNLLIANSLAICDVSGSMLMSQQKVMPMYGAIGLTFILMQISSGTWRNRCISFSENPVMFELDVTGLLREKIKRMLEMDFGMSTNLNKSFDLLIDHGKSNNISDAEMPKVLFIFTDMEFNEAVAERNETNFERCRKQFAEAGYTMPLIVFWNLKGDKTSRSTPVKCFEEGVFLLSGYSAQTLNFFFSCDDLRQMTPIAMLRKVLDDPRYDPVTVSMQTDDRDAPPPALSGDAIQDKCPNVKSDTPEAVPMSE